jgi:hypothetical protein
MWNKDVLEAMEVVDEEREERLEMVLEEGARVENKSSLQTNHPGADGGSHAGG